MYIYMYVYFYVYVYVYVYVFVYMYYITALAISRFRVQSFYRHEHCAYFYGMVTLPSGALEDLV